jgi:hypothetical protein
MNRTLAGMHMRNPPHYFSLGAALREFLARRIGVANAHFVNGVSVAQSTVGPTSKSHAGALSDGRTKVGGSRDSEKTTL